MRVEFRALETTDKMMIWEINVPERLRGDGDAILRYCREYSRRNPDEAHVGEHTETSGDWEEIRFDD